ncbi:uncharacterized protein [Panulirus ornatus]|uniref:uncharacterized protein n=1 Tax=Panulirus ornatus TaxID=150431 RepID=UPI003A8ABF67
MRSSLLRVALLVASLAGVTGTYTVTIHYDSTLPNDSFMWNTFTPSLCQCKNFCFAVPNCTAVTALQLPSGGIKCHISYDESPASILQYKLRAVTMISNVLPTSPENATGSDTTETTTNGTEVPSV